METIKQAIKYGVVGLSNTLITMIVIWVMMKLFGCREGLSNLTGYVAGILNSFIWNKQWTFKGSSTGWTKGAVRFTIAFIICYALQYGLVLILNSRLTIDHYYNHLIVHRLADQSTTRLGSGNILRHRHHGGLAG